MKSKIKIIFLVGLLSFGAYYYLGKSPSSNNINKLKTNWNTFQHKKEKITTHPTTESELKKIRQTHQTTESKKEIKNNFRDGRRIIGKKAKKYSDPTTELTMRNSKSNNWKKKMVKDLFRFQKKSTKLMIKHEEEVLMVYGKKGRLAELVVINYHNADGSNNSYRALIDSQTGLVINTWDFMVKENFNKPVARKH
ncbi:MAG: hypothetical protein HOJ35_01965 [Bdellovibrionales bacterium]|jgi:hypothetical protein|nr:hypothetical protein [Bdellovibrionales bacterium]